MSLTHREVPSVFLVGAQKAGTSALHRLLVRRAGLHGPLHKEFHYFSYRFYRETLSEYSAKYTEGVPRRIFSKPPMGIDSSPSYMFHPFVPQRIRSLIPDARILFLLRDPVERAISHYRHNRRQGREIRGLEEALGWEVPQHLPSATEEEWDSPKSDIRHTAYLERGLYSYQIENFWEHFPVEQTLVLFSRDFLERPAAVLGDISHFLGIRSSRREVLARRLPHRPEMVSQKFREHLVVGYAREKRRLQGLLGRSVPWWES